MKFILPVTIAIALSSCGSTVSYNYPTTYQELNIKSSIDVSNKEFTTTLATTYIGPLQFGGGYDNATSKLLDENQGYDFVVNPKVKSKTATIIPGITQKMERVTAKLGRYR